MMKCAGKGIICKSEVEKAFDHVNWDFLLVVLDKMSFGLKWISWIKWRMSMACFSVLVNGTLSDYF